MRGVIRVGRDYLEWAHGPAADDGYPPAVRLLALLDGGRKVATIPLEDEELRRELHSAADLWDSPETAREDGAGNPSARRAARRIMRELGPYVYQVVSTAPRPSDAGHPSTGANSPGEMFS
jgi:hypothetical protein